MSTEPLAAPNRMLERVGQILDAVDGDPATASELARRTGLSVSTVHRLAQSMVAQRFLIRLPDARYAAGTRVTRSTIEDRALPHLTALRDETGETTQLWVLSGSDRVCRLSVESEHPLRVILPRGSRVPLPLGSAGQLLAGTPQAVASEREHGWVESIETRTPGVSSVSVPIRRDDEILAAVCVVIPVARLRRSPGSDVGHKVVTTASAIAHALKP